MIKKILFSFVLIFAAFGFWYVNHPNPSKVLDRIFADPALELRKKRVAKLITEEKANFASSLNSKPTSWMLEQIEEDFSYVTNKKIDENSTSSTWDKVKNDSAFMRVKIIDGKLYYSDLNPTSRKTILLDALKFIISQTKLPNIDIIVYDGDILVEKVESFRAPIFLFSVHKDYRANRVLIPDSLTLRNFAEIYYSILELNSDIPWGKKINQAFWRGSTTCSFYDKSNYYSSFTSLIDEQNYSECPRIRLADFSKDHPELIDAKFTGLVQMTESTKMLLSKKYEIVKNASKKEHLKYKIQPTINGNTATWPGFAWRLLSNSITLKDEAPDIQWFYRIVKPWEHYVPIKPDMSDLEEKIKWVLANDVKAKEIADNSTKLMIENMKITDMYRYFIVLFEEYAKLQNYKPLITSEDIPYSSVN